MDFNISSFLEKFKNIAPPDDFLKKTFISVVKDETGIEVLCGDIKITHGTIYLSASPTIKSELYIKKPLLLKRMSAALSKEQISDIR
ncbi:MAG: hypothetical protein Q8R36_00985 [bacterium]|nr:hypothetical protein [bacterium]